MFEDVYTKSLIFRVVMHFLKFIKHQSTG